MRFPRASGILLHPTSLPGRYGIGDLGLAAYEFVDFLVGAGQQLWQILPLGPTGYGDSPYQCFSAFAGNPLLICLEKLLEDGHLKPDELAVAPAFPEDWVDYGAVIRFKIPLLKRSLVTFEHQATATEKAEFAQFIEDHRVWLDDFALFMALKDHHGGAVWNAWPADIATRQPRALEHWRKALAREIRTQQYLQFQFFRQWKTLKRYANERGIRIIGDIPIFVAYDSADAWANPEQFYFDEAGRPIVVAGVPPDYFSETGQLWGNPLYRWDVMAQDGYRWWIRRLQATLELVDIVRLDHFRGFVGYWAVPATEKTAVNGEWREGPGADLFWAVEQALGQLPIIAEDLGFITPEVRALRDQFQFPGMKILQFAFSTDADDPFLPHNYERNCVVYTGTHDNDTTIGWYQTAPPHEQDFVRRYLARDGHDIAWDLMRLAQSSVADLAITPLQDVLRLGSEARMNLPSRAAGNWRWRYRREVLTHELQGQLREMAILYGRFHPPK